MYSIYVMFCRVYSSCMLVGTIFQSHSLYVDTALFLDTICWYDMAILSWHYMAVLCGLIYEKNWLKMASGMGALVGLALFSINWPSKQYSHSYIGLSPDCFILLTRENFHCSVNRQPSATLLVTQLSQKQIFCGKGPGNVSGKRSWRARWFF